ncbi:MraY family glycosyltransferase [Euzebya rosea]|uniref:MraY family glycosyltransferase n=1 Tax=Euzebya rosea TaxID=2052804 RepID=UPI0013009A16|nr:MraY family glycosyltransferase [Euzebya rosea]
MGELVTWAYPAIFLVAGMLSWLLVPVAMKVAIQRDFVDRPGGYKSQESPVPYLGGVAIVVSFAAVVLAAAILRPPISGLDELVVILGTAVLLSLMGLIDDLRGLGPFLRLAVVAAATGLLIFTDISVRLVDSGGPVDIAITILWVAGITNAFNLLDNMDGLSAGIGTIASISLFVIAVFNGQFLVAALSAALAGCAIGFLRHNFHPARVYMGDAGSLFIGFVLAVLALKLRFDAPRQITAFVPIVVLGLPILDTTLVTITRLRHGRNPLSGGRDHLSHRLVFIGLSVPHAVKSLYGVAIALGWVGLIVSRLDVGTAYLVLGLVGAVLVTAGFLLGRVPVYSNSIQRKIVLQSVEKTDADYAHEHQTAGMASTDGS